MIGFGCVNVGVGVGVGEFSSISYIRLKFV